MQSVKLRSSGPSFLSRLEESKEASSSSTAAAAAAAGAHGNSSGEEQNQSTSVRWNFSTTTTQSRQGGRQLLSAVSEEIPEKQHRSEKDPPATNRSTRDDRREERRRMRSKSRGRQGNRDSDDKRKTPKWSDLNNSISNLNASKGTFDFDASLSGEVGDNKQTTNPNTNRCKSVQPKITPVAIKNGGKLDADVIASVLARTGAIVSSSQDKRRRSGTNDVGEIINETKNRTREIRKRRAKPTKPERSSSLLQSSHSTPEYPSHMDAMERLRRANTLILEKKKRREDSKARQKQLENENENENDGPSDDLMAMVSFHESRDGMEPHFAPVVQFEPVLGKDPADDVDDIKPTEHRSGRSNIKGLKSLKKGMKYIGKSGRNLMALVSSEDDDDNDDNDGDDGNDKNPAGEAHSASNTERRRSRRADREKHSSSQKSSKWKDLKNGLDSLKKRPADNQTGEGFSFDEPEPRLEAPKSIRWGSQRKVRTIDDELDFPDDSVPPPKKSGSSRWGSVKNSISFINKMKHAAEANN